MSRGSGLYEVVTTAGVPVRLHDMRPPKGWRHGSAQQAKVGPLARLSEGLVKVRRTLHVPSGFRRREGADQERRARDSNPRGACTPSGFQDRRHRPLGEPSNTPNDSHRRTSAQVQRVYGPSGTRFFEAPAPRQPHNPRTPMRRNGSRRPRGGGEAGPVLGREPALSRLRGAAGSRPGRLPTQAAAAYDAPKPRSRSLSRRLRRPLPDRQRGHVSGGGVALPVLLCE